MDDISWICLMFLCLRDDIGLSMVSCRAHSSSKWRVASVCVAGKTMTSISFMTRGEHVNVGNVSSQFCALAWK